MSSILYQDQRFEGRKVTLTDSDTDLRKIDFNYKVSSIVVQKGRWILWTKRKVLYDWSKKL